LLFFEGAVFENHRKEWISGLTLGAIYHSKRRLSATHELSETFHWCISASRLWCSVALRQDPRES